MNIDNNLITVLSLIVALVAATAGPLVTMAAGRIQRKSNQEQLEEMSRQFQLQLSEQQAQAKQQVISPMRQQWINTLRDLVAEILSTAIFCHLNNLSVTSDERQRLAARESKLELLINPKEDDHCELVKAVRYVVNSIGEKDKNEIHKGHKQAIKIAQKVLKREWEVTKQGETSQWRAA